MEMVDGFVIIKVDGENWKCVNLVVVEVWNVIYLFLFMDSGWILEVIMCSLLENYNLDVIFVMVLCYVEYVKIKGYFEKNCCE